MQSNNEIKLEQHGEVIILDVRGDITSLSEIFFKEAYQKALDQKAQKIIFKIEKDAYINSGGISLIIQTLYRMQENKQIAAIAGISEHFKKIFGMVGITKFAKIYDTVDTALQALGG